MLALSGGLDPKMLKYVLRLIFRFTLQVKIEHGTKREHGIRERSAAAQLSCCIPPFTQTLLIN